jgi:outer membrane protein assembly factor BamB
LRDKESSIGELDGRAGIGASGWSNPVRSFITDKVFHVFDTIICLDASTGKELWRKEFLGAPVHLTLDIGPSSTPTISDGKCYVAGSAGFYCVNVKDGSVVWQAKTRFSHSSPLVLDGVVYCLVPEATAFDAKTGQVLWVQPTLKHTDCNFTKWTNGGKTYLIVAFPGSVYDHPPGAIFCLDPAADGKVLWSAQCSTGETPVIAGPDTLVCYNGFSVRAYKLTPAKATMLWETKDVGGPRGSSPVIYQDSIYLAGACHSGDALCCLDLKTGEKKWNPRKFCAESSSPVAVDGKIIAMPEVDELTLFVVMYKATPEKFEELGRFTPHAGPGASPTIVNGKMYLRLEDCVACYDLAQHDP